MVRAAGRAVKASASDGKDIPSRLTFPRPARLPQRRSRQVENLGYGVGSGERAWVAPSRRDGQTQVENLRYGVGSRIVKVVPTPGMLSTTIVPAWACTMCLTMERPRPVPPRLRLRALSTR